MATKKKKASLVFEDNVISRSVINIGDKNVLHVSQTNHLHPPKKKLAGGNKRWRDLIEQSESSSFQGAQKNSRGLMGQNNEWAVNGDSNSRIKLVVLHIIKNSVLAEESGYCDLLRITNPFAALIPGSGDVKLFLVL